MFPDKLKALRKEANLTQVEISKKLNISQPAYVDWEKGRTQPTPDKLPLLAEILHTSIDYLLGKTDERKNPLESATVLFRSTIKDFDLTPEQEEQFKQDINTFIEQRRKAFEEDAQK